MTELESLRNKQKKIIWSAYYSKRPVVLGAEPVKEEGVDAYYYPDVEYDVALRANWKAFDHLLRLEKEVLRAGEERLAGDAAFRETMLGVLRYWILHDFINPNWWHNQVGAPKLLVDMALVFDEYLTDDLKEGLEKCINRGSFKPYLPNNDMEPGNKQSGCLSKPTDMWTGANLLWAAATTIKYALWTRDEVLLRYTTEVIAKELEFSKEGVLPDGSFCQHGIRWYSGGYGRSYVYEFAPIVSVLQGSSFEIPRDRLDVLLLHILDGQQMMQHKGCFDYGAIGREMVRPGTVFVGTLKKAIELLLGSENLPRKEELARMYAELCGEALGCEGTKYYETLRLICHKKNGMYISVRGRDENVLGAEACNEEGVLCYNMTYGTVTCVMEDGAEYVDVAPVWDYCKIPGTTARVQSDEQLMELMEGTNWGKSYETLCRSYGKVIQDQGLLTQKVVHDGVSVLTSFFVFDGALVCLGSCIADEMPQKGALYTTVEQCNAKEVVIREGCVRNGKVSYINLDPCTKLEAQVEQRQGDWHRNSLQKASTPAKGRILTVSIPVAEHGAYAYLVCGPQKPKVEVLQNDRFCQAILVNDSFVMAVFHQEGEISVKGLRITGSAGNLTLERV